MRTRFASEIHAARRALRFLAFAASSAGACGCLETSDVERAGAANTAIVATTDGGRSMPRPTDRGAGGGNFQTTFAPGSWPTDPAPARGTTLWSSTKGGTSDDYAASVAITSTGTSVVVGGLTGTANVGCGTMAAIGTSDVFVASYDASGICLWSKRFGGGADTYAMDVVLDASDRIFLTGYFAGSTDFGGGALASVGGYDGFVLGLSSAGDFAWATRFGGASDDTPYGIAIAPATAAGPLVIVGGTFAATASFGGGDLVSAGDLDGFVATYAAPTGAHVWNTRMGGSGYDAVNAIASVGGAIVIAGTATGSIDLGNGATTPTGGSDVLLASYTTSGGIVWSKQLGGTGDDQAYALALDVAGGAHVAGYFSASASFGGTTTLTASNGTAMFTALYDATGTFTWAQTLDAGGQVIPLGLDVDSDGTTYVTGAFSGSFAARGIASTGDRDAFLVAYDSSSSLVLLTSYSGTGSEVGSNLALTATSVVTVGYFDATVDFGSGAQVTAGKSDMFIAAASKN